MENCVFTDVLEKKANLNVGLLCCDGDMDAVSHRTHSRTAQVTVWRSVIAMRFDTSGSAGYPDSSGSCG
jgi:hypothetical protein